MTLGPLSRNGRSPDCDRRRITISIDVDENTHDCVVFISEPRFIGHVFKCIVSLIHEQATAAAITFLVEDILTFDQIKTDVTGNEKVEVTVAIEICDRHRHRRCVFRYIER